MPADFKFGESALRWLRDQWKLTPIQIGYLTDAVNTDMRVARVAAWKPPDPAVVRARQLRSELKALQKGKGK